MGERRRHVLTGNLDRPGGRMFPHAAHASPDPDAPSGRGWRVGRFASRVKGYPEAFGQLPIATLADEIETPGDGQVRALVTIGGNPVLSSPNGRRLSRALETLDFMVALDPYVNETTRFADVVLPPTGLLERHHYDFAFYGLAVRNVANYSPPLLPAQGPDEWEVLSRLALVAAGQSVSMDPAVVPMMGLSVLVERAVGPGGSLAGRSTAEIMKALEGRDPCFRSSTSDCGRDRTATASRTAPTGCPSLRWSAHRTASTSAPRARGFRTLSGPRRERWSSHRPRSSPTSTASRPPSRALLPRWS